MSSRSRAFELNARFVIAFAAACYFGANVGTAEPPTKTKSRFSPLSNAKAWDRLPREAPTLPVWARILSRPLPRVTAGMLRLDYVHRAKNPLDPVLRGKLRWLAAVVNRSEYSRRYAEADLKRAGLKPSDFKDLEAVSVALATSIALPGRVSADDRAALTFARKMTLAAHSVTDEEFAALLKRFGPERVVAMVHTLAHANFQDRVFLALGVQVEDGGPYPPVELSSAAKVQSGVSAPKRSPWKSVLSAKFDLPVQTSKPKWNNNGFDGVQKLLANQKARKSRIPVPTRKGDPAKPLSRVLWSAVSMGYQPVLTRAWFNCMGRFGGESKLDRVFSNSMFWVITRSNECFY